MNEVHQIKAYHGTDRKYLADIKKNGFQCKKNEQHWLGNGIYFFLDEKLAEEWAKDTPSLFGHAHNPNPVVIVVLLASTDENTIDTMIEEDNIFLEQCYDEFYKEMKQQGEYFDLSSRIGKNKMRCLFFEWIHRVYGIEIFIVGFEKERKRNVSQIFGIPKLEYQVCVYDKKLICIQEERDLL